MIGYWKDRYGDKIYLLAVGKDELHMPEDSALIRIGEHGSEEYLMVHEDTSGEFIRLYGFSYYFDNLIKEEQKVENDKMPIREWLKNQIEDAQTRELTSRVMKKEVTAEFQRGRVIAYKSVLEAIKEGEFEDVAEPKGFWATWQSSYGGPVMKVWFRDDDDLSLFEQSPSVGWVRKEDE